IHLAIPCLVLSIAGRVFAPSAPVSPDHPWHSSGEQQIEEFSHRLPESGFSVDASKRKSKSPSVGASRYQLFHGPWPIFRHHRLSLSARQQSENKLQGQLHVEWLTRTDTRCAIVVADSVGALAKSPE